LAFLAGCTIAFFLQRLQSDERAEQVSKLNESEMLGFSKIPEVEKSRSLAEQQPARLAADNSDLKAALAAERQKNEDLLRLLTTSPSELENATKQLTERTQDPEQIQKKLTTEFENIANSLLKVHYAEFTTINQKNIGDILTPLKNKIMTIEKKLKESYEKPYETRPA